MKRTSLCVDLHLLDAFPYLRGSLLFWQHELCWGTIQFPQVLWLSQKYHRCHQILIEKCLPLHTRYKRKFVQGQHGVDPFLHKFVYDNVRDINHKRYDTGVQHHGDFAQAPYQKHHQGEPQRSAATFSDGRTHGVTGGDHIEMEAHHRDIQGAGQWKA